jgi:hypothetical protein
LSAKSWARQELWLYVHQKFVENKISASYPNNADYKLLK